MRKATASSDAEHSKVLAPQQRRLSALVAILAGVAIVPLVGVANRPAPAELRGDQVGRNTTLAAHSHPQMFQPPIIAAVDPALSKFTLNAQALAASMVAPGDPLPPKMDPKKWVPQIKKAMRAAHITTLDQEAAFLAQISEESGGLGMVNEMPWGLDRSQWNDEQAVRDYFNNKYAAIGGNGDVGSGDGYNFRGRGILQITGRNNYAAISQELYGDDRLLKNPELLAEPQAACAAAAAYWNQNNLNRFIPPGPVTPDEFQDLGSTINTGSPGNVPNNAAERVRYWEVAKQSLGIT